MKPDIMTPNDSQQTESIVFTVSGAQQLMLSTLSVADVIAHLGYFGQPIAVARNGEVVPRNQHSATRLLVGDRFEFVVAAQGG